MTRPNAKSASEEEFGYDVGDLVRMSHPFQDGTFDERIYRVVRFDEPYNNPKSRADGLRAVVHDTARGIPKWATLTAPAREFVRVTVKQKKARRR